MKRVQVLQALVLCLAITACGGATPVDDYRQAISAVEGVETVDIGYTVHGGTGDSTDIDITADTNDAAALHRILDESLKAFIETTVPGDETSLNYLVYSRNRSVHLTPGDLSTGLRTLSDIRRHYGLDHRPS